MRSILDSPLQLFLYFVAQCILLLILIVNKDSVPMVMSLIVIVTILLTVGYLLVSVFRAVVLKFSTQDSPAGDMQKLSTKFPLALILILFMTLGYMTLEVVEKERAAAVKAVVKSDLVGDWRQREVLDGEKRLNREHYFVSGPAFFRFGADDSMTQVIVETMLPADDKAHLTSYLYLSTTPHKHSYTLKEEKGLGEFIDQNGRRYPVWLAYFAGEMAFRKLPKQIADKVSHYSPQKGDLLVGYMNPAGGIDYFRVLTRVDETYFSSAE